MSILLEDQTGSEITPGELSPSFVRPWNGHASHQDQPKSAPLPAITQREADVSLDKRYLSIALVDGYAFTREAIARALRDTSTKQHVDVYTFKTLQDFLVSPNFHDVIVYHSHATKAESIADMADLLQSLSSHAPVVLLNDSESMDAVCTALHCGVRGYVPTTSTAFELIIEIIHFIKAGGTFVPPSVLSARAVNHVSANKPTSKKFTSRQLAVLECLRVGKTNKVIAYELKLSESSVKAHIQHILKKLNATNRTQVACIAQNWEVNRMY